VGARHRIQSDIPANSTPTPPPGVHPARPDPLLTRPTAN